MKILQFSAGVASGDGVTGGIMLIDKLLKELGHRSDVVSFLAPDELKQTVASALSYPYRDCELMLIHHSLGHDHGFLLDLVPCDKVLVYHNITPAQYLAADMPEQALAERGREQLSEWRHHFAAAIGMSAFNTAELEQLGYQNVTTIPLLVDPDRFSDVSAEAVQLPGNDGRPLIIAVGRLVDNKRQHLLVEAMQCLQQYCADKEMPLPLLAIVGSNASPAYQRRLAGQIKSAGLDGDVLLLGKCSEAELCWLYRQAVLLWCASMHEGFCMPLIEAASFGLPSIAFAEASVPDTLGESGLLLKTPADPAELAYASIAVLESEPLQAKLKGACERNLERFSGARLSAQLQLFLAQFEQH